MRFGIVGAGSIAQTYASAFADSAEARLVAVCDVRQVAARAMADANNCRSYSDVDQMCQEAGPQAVVVCTPPATHPAMCEHLMECGCHVLCEKPLATDSASALRLLAAAEQTGVHFTMASKFRYVDDVIKARALITSGLPGDVVLFENCFTGTVDMSTRWNSDPRISGGGVLIDNGTHSVDIMRYLFGPVVELQVVEGKRIQRLPVEDTVRMFVRTADEVLGNIDLSWSVSKEQPTYISIYGSHGTILIGWRKSQYRRPGDNEWTVFGSGYNKLQAFRSQINNFTRAIRGEEDLLITPGDALASVQVIETAYRALDTHRWAPVAVTGQAVPEPV